MNPVMKHLGRPVGRTTAMERTVVLGFCLAALTCTPTSASAVPGDGLIVFQSDRGGQSDIWIMEADGSNQRNLTNDKAEDLFPSWSRDGKKIAWTRGGRTPAGEIWIMNLDGSGKTRVTSNGFADYNATWSPDNSELIFQSPRIGGRSDLFAIRVDGTGERQLTNNPASDIGPDWSPDGSRVLFASNRTGHYAIYTMNPDGSDVRQLTEDFREAAIGGWSPDGTRILFGDGFCDTCGESDLFVMNPDGTGIVQVTDSPENELSKSWSRDGSRCVADFANLSPSEKHLGKGDVAIVDIGTGATINLTNTPGINEEHPIWSPVRRSMPETASNVASTSGGRRAAESNSIRVRSVAGRQPALLYTLPREGRVLVRIFDVAGRQIGTAVNAWQSAGVHTLPLATDGEVSRVLLYRLEYEGKTSTGKVVAVR